MLYLAYGSNLNVAQMALRCPRAVKVGKSTIPNTRLVFRGVADIEPCEGAEAHVGVWSITEACEVALDRYEGVRGGLYRKEYLPLRIRVDGEEMEEKALVYVMNSHSYEEPGIGYYNVCKRGYQDFGLPVSAIAAARRESKALAAKSWKLWHAARAGNVEVVA